MPTLKQKIATVMAGGETQDIEHYGKRYRVSLNNTKACWQEIYAFPRWTIRWLRPDGMREHLSLATHAMLFGCSVRGCGVVDARKRDTRLHPDDAKYYADQVFKSMTTPASTRLTRILYNKATK